MDVIVGIDVSKDRLDVHVLPSAASFAVGNDDAGLDELVVRLRAVKADIVAVEATGGYEAGFGEFQPIAEGGDDAARATNRRIELKLTEK